MTKLLLAAVLVALCAAQSFTVSPVQNNVLKCSRTIDRVMTPKHVDIISIRKCTNDKVGFASDIGFSIDTNYRPDIITGYWLSERDASNAAAAWTWFRIVFERIIEYVEVNNIPGYQPGPNPTDDKPGVITFLWMKQWNPIEETVTALSNGGSVHDFTATTSDGEFSFSFSFSTDYVVGINKTLLVPSSGKITFSVNNYVYQWTNTTGLAARVFVVAHGGVADKPKTDTNTDLDLTTQSGVNIETNGDFSRAFFTWDEFVKDSKGSQLDVHAETLAIDTDIANANITIDATLHISTIWFSVPSRATSLTWDPYFGVSDTPSGAQSIVASLLLMFASFIVALF